MLGEPNQGVKPPRAAQKRDLLRDRLMSMGAGKRTTSDAGDKGVNETSDRPEHPPDEESHRSIRERLEDWAAGESSGFEAVRIIAEPRVAR